MKVLFLDVDGVLNTWKTLSKIDMENGRFRGLDTTLVQLLTRWLAKEPSVKVVLSSTWRTDTLAKKALNEHGITWISETPDLKQMRGRGAEIALWLSNNSHVTHYAILDDINDMTPVQNALVLVNETNGLTYDHLKKVEEILEL